MDWELNDPDDVVLVDAMELVEDAENDEVVVVVEDVEEVE